MLSRLFYLKNKGNAKDYSRWNDQFRGENNITKINYNLLISMK